MSLSESIAIEFEHEMGGTRKVLERIPADKLDWKIHPKSNSIGWNAAHIASLAGWPSLALQAESYDIAPPGGEPYRTPAAGSPQEILDRFDANVAAARTAIAAASDDALRQPWSLLRGGQTLFTMPRLAVLRGFVINHIVHHRAHLCVYLRLNDIPVPALYGPSGDEGRPG